MPYVALNNAASTLSGGVAAIDTAISVQIGHGAKFAVGANYSYLTLQDASNNIEIVKLTGVTGDVLTIVREQDGTAARTWAIGDVISCRPCAAAFNDYAVAPQTNTSASKATPVDADELPLTDSAATFGLKKLTWANLKATLVTYFNTLFTKVDGSNATGTWGISISGNAATATNATNAPTSANNLVRAVDLQAQTVTAFTTGGTSTAFTGAPNPPVTSNAAGQRFTATLHAAPTGPFTLSVSGQPAMNVVFWNANLGSWQIVGAAHAKQWYPCDVVSDGINWILLNPIPIRTALMAVQPGGYSTSVTLTATDMNKLVYYYGGGAGTLTLPAAPAVGDTATISAISTGTCTIARSGSQLIYARGVGGATSTSIALGESISLVFDGTNWIQFAGAGPSLGDSAQVWQSVTRTPGTTYTNSTGRPISVSIAFTTSANNVAGSISVSVNGGGTFTIGQAGGGAVNQSTGSCFFIVPVGATYVFTHTGVTNVFYTELR